MNRGTACLLFLFVFVAASRVSAKVIAIMSCLGVCLLAYVLSIIFRVRNLFGLCQDFFVEDDDARSTGSIRDLGRRSKVSTLSFATPIVTHTIAPMPESLHKRHNCWEMWWKCG